MLDGHRRGAVSRKDELSKGGAQNALMRSPEWQFVYGSEARAILLAFPGSSREAKSSATTNTMLGYRQTEN